MDDRERSRAALIETLRRDGLANEVVLEALSRVPREAFVPPDLADRAYENVALPIGGGQTISQPYVVALMTQELALTGTECVLEIGTGSGYQTAILARLARSVVSVERVPALQERAAHVLASLGIASVELHAASATLGWLAGAPYDRIIVTAGGPEVPSVLLEQLADGGRLVMPVGTLAQQRLLVVQRIGDRFAERELGGVRFVPLIGPGGWSEAEATQVVGNAPDDAP